MKKITRTINGCYVTIKAYNDRVNEVQIIEDIIPFKKLNKESHDYILELLKFRLFWSANDTTIINVEFHNTTSFNLAIPLDFNVVLDYSTLY